mmetsp:Transcript_10192/g.25578  ORF Transcript_10192/g.25578 Transcript_10192/m.25578 type:complete len:343 (+) Transcript_10192:193-1221(+)
MTTSDTIKPDDSNTETEPMTSPTPHASPYGGLFWALGYAIVSILLTILNKEVLSVYKFNFSGTITIMQLFVQLFLLLMYRWMGVISFPGLNQSTLIKMLPLSLLFDGMVVTGLAALFHVNVPLYGALRRFTTVLVMLFQYFFLKRSTPRDEALTVFGMIFGASIAAAVDLNASFIGYIEVLLNCLFTALYLVDIQYRSAETQLNSYGLMYYNCVLSLPVIFPIMLFELESVLEYPLLRDPTFLFWFFMSGILAFYINFFIFQCSTLNSPLTTSITGQLKNVLTTALGFMLFGDASADPRFLMSISVSMAFSFLYSYVKYRQTLSRLPGAKERRNSNEADEKV